MYIIKVNYAQFSVARYNLVKVLDWKNVTTFGKDHPQMCVFSVYCFAYNVLHIIKIWPTTFLLKHLKYQCPLLNLNSDVKP